MPIDYKALWEELINELTYLKVQGVKEMHPQLVKKYMSLMVARDVARNDEKPS